MKSTDEVRDAPKGNRLLQILLVLVLASLAILDLRWYVFIPGKHEKEISGGLQAAYKAGVRHLPVTQLAHFQWELVCMFDTATDKKTVDEAVGMPVQWSTGTLPWLNHSDYWTLLFKDRHDEVRLVKLRKGKTGNPQFREQCLRRNEAMFLFVDPPPNGRHGVTLVKR